MATPRKLSISIYRTGHAGQDCVATVRKALHDVTDGYRRIPFDLTSTASPWNTDVADLVSPIESFNDDTPPRDLLIVISDQDLPPSLGSNLLSRHRRVAFVRLGQHGGAVNEPIASAFSAWPISASGDLGNIACKLILKLCNEMRGYWFSPIETDSQIHDYLQLRYTTWKQEGYLLPGLANAGVRYEVDSLDRHAFPIGVWSSTRKTMLGCVRLVFPAGRTSEFGNQIGSYLKLNADATHLKLFQPVSQPTDMAFDVLTAIDGFRDYYKKLITADSNIRLGEIGRVITNRRFRLKSIAYSLVETALFQAQQEGLHAVFLACKLRHTEFYKRLGFHVLDGTDSDTFINGIDQKCVAMGCSLDLTRVDPIAFAPVLEGAIT